MSEKTGKSCLFSSEYVLKSLKTSDATLQESAELMKQVKEAVGQDKFQWEKYFTTGATYRWSLNPRAQQMLFKANKEYASAGAEKTVAMFVDTYQQHEVRWLFPKDIVKIQAALGESVAKCVYDFFRRDDSSPSLIPCIFYIGKESNPRHCHVASALLPRISLDDVSSRPSVDQEVLYVARFWNSMISS